MRARRWRRLPRAAALRLATSSSCAARSRRRPLGARQAVIQLSDARLAAARHCERRRSPSIELFE